MIEKEQLMVLLITDLSSKDCGFSGNFKQEIENFA